MLEKVVYSHTSFVLLIRFSCYGFCEGRDFLFRFPFWKKSSFSILLLIPKRKMFRTKADWNLFVHLAFSGDVVCTLSSFSFARSFFWRRLWSSLRSSIERCCSASRLLLSSLVLRIFMREKPMRREIVATSWKLNYRQIVFWCWWTRFSRLPVRLFIFRIACRSERRTEQKC